MPTSGRNVLTTESTRKEDPETRLMSRVATGDDAAFESLVDRCQAGLIQFFAMLSGNRALGEDLAQEVFIRLYRHRAAYRAKARFKTYLYRIAKNLWHDHLRSRHHRVRSLSLDAPDARGHSLAQTLATQPCEPIPLEREALHQAIGKLPEEQKAVLLLNLIEELNYAEIAATLDVPVGTVKSRMHHAVRKLRVLMKQG